MFATGSRWATCVIDALIRVTLVGMATCASVIQVLLKLMAGAFLTQQAPVPMILHPVLLAATSILITVSVSPVQMVV